MVPPELTDINDHTIDLEASKHLPKTIYGLGPLELGTLKIYIKINLVHWFVRLFKSPTRTPILFMQNLMEVFGFALFTEVSFT